MDRQTSGRVREGQEQYLNTPASPPLPQNPPTTLLSPASYVQEPCTASASELRTNPPRFSFCLKFEETYARYPTASTTAFISSGFKSLSGEATVVKNNVVETAKDNIVLITSTSTDDAVSTTTTRNDESTYEENKLESQN